ncbi:MAG: hypothetical protein IJP68_10490 [Selenomonadaceae bacterium]|nr:hypothetical protein [Selenomonadaceae bacterium]
MAYNPNDVARLKHVAQLAQVVKSNLDALDSNAIQYVSTSGNTVSFFTNNDGSGTAAFSFDFPEELFLDQAGTTLVENFTWSALSYPNSTNPNLDGKTVLVLAVKGDAQTPTVKYSFVDLSKLIDTYTPADNSIAINGHSVAVNISATTGNALSLANDGLLVDISGKVDKVNGKQLSSEDFTTAEKTKLGGISEGAQVNVIETVKVDNVALTPNNKAVNIDLSGKVDKVTNAPQGNIAVFGANGAIANGGLSIADISYSVATSLESGLMSASDKAKLDSFNFPNDDDVTNMLNSIFT